MCNKITVVCTEPESADNTTEMVFIDQPEDIRYDSAEFLPGRTGDLLTRTAQERHQSGRRQCTCTACISSDLCSICMFLHYQGFYAFYHFVYYTKIRN